MMDARLAVMARLAARERAAAAKAAAAAAAGFAASLAAGATDCRNESLCRPLAARESTARPEAADPQRCEAARSDVKAALAKLRPVIAQTYVLADTCSTLACPEADCEARKRLAEEAAFAESLIAALGTAPAEAEAEKEGDGRARIVARAFKAFGTLAGAIRAAGTAEERVTEAARTLSRTETALAELRSRPGAPQHARDPAWRATAAKFAVAGVRDALGRLQLAGSREEAGELWTLAARRVGAAGLALARLEAETQARTQPKAAQAGAQPCFSQADDLIASPLAEARTALDGVARCNVRAGCDTEAAVLRGRERAALLAENTVLDAPLDVLRALDEELRLSPALEAGQAHEAPPPKVILDLPHYRQGEAMTVALDPRPNRCLAEGGFALMTPMPPEADAAATPPAVEAVKDVHDRLRIEGGKAQSLLFAAPEEGTQALRVFAGLEHGGREVGRIPVEVREPAPSVCKGFTGTWLTEFGRLVTVEREGGTVRGTYRRIPLGRPGFLVGERIGDRLDAEWISEIGNGGTRLELKGEGVFRGTWGLSPGAYYNGGTWSGICAPPGAASPDAPPKPDAPTQ